MTRGESELQSERFVAARTGRMLGNRKRGGKKEELATVEEVFWYCDGGVAYDGIEGLWVAEEEVCGIDKAAFNKLDTTWI